MSLLQSFSRLRLRPLTCCPASAATAHTLTQTPLLPSQHAALPSSQPQRTIKTLLAHQKLGHNPLRLRGRGPAPLKPNTRRSPDVRKRIQQTQLQQWTKKYGDKPKLNGPVTYQPPAWTNHHHLSQPIIDLYGKQQHGAYELNPRVWTAPLRPDVVHEVVKWQRAKARVGSASTLTRAEVSGTGRKPHPQKGTGRARQGTLRAPHMRGGGIAHGPKPRDWSYSLNKKLRRLAMRVTLSAKLRDKQFTIIDNLILNTHSTAQLAALLQQHQLYNPEQPHTTRVLLCYSKAELDDNIVLAGRNLIGFDLIEQVGLNVLTMLRHENLIITRKAVEELELRLDELERKSFEHSGTDASQMHHQLLYGDAEADAAAEQEVIAEIEAAADASSSKAQSATA